jgi:hypothetical protein
MRFAKVENGVVIDVTEADEAPEGWVECGDVGPGATVSNDIFTPAPQAAPNLKITKLAFRSRFTPTEKATLEMASLDNPLATQQLRFLAASLRATFADQRDATHIDLGRSDTIAGVNSLVAAGLLTAPRAAAILLPVIAAHEAYRE